MERTGLLARGNKELADIDVCRAVGHPDDFLGNVLWCEGVDARVDWWRWGRLRKKWLWLCDEMTVLVVVVMVVTMMWWLWICIIY